jgi:hypothetical protein
MAAVTVVSGTKAHKASLGGLLMEVVNCTVAADADTYTTIMQRPLFALFVANTDGNTTQLGTNVAVSGRTVTFNDSNLSSTTGTLLVFGF